MIQEKIDERENLEAAPIVVDDFLVWFKQTFLADNEGGNAHGGYGLESLKILCVTWNVGNAMPIHDMSKFFAKGGEDYDIIAIGAQECKYDTKVPSDWTPVAEEAEMMTQKTVKGWHHWFGVISTHLGEQWQPVELQELWEMRLIVFAKKDLAPQITDIHSAQEATGIAHILGNKGGLVVRFSCRDTTFAFVSCHLAAHEGKKHREARNSNCSEVLEGARVGIEQMDIVPQTDHVFWMGDLNYRLDPYQFGMMEKPEDGSEKLPKSGTPDHKVVWDKIQGWINNEQWAEIFKHDELREELLAKRVLCGFEEGEYNFPPTFKVLTQKKMAEECPEQDPSEKPMAYTTQRWPSYCDRILWHSHPGKLGDVKQLELTSCPHVFTSDHKPVKSSFDVKLRPKPESLPSDQPSDAPDIWISDLKGHGKIKVMDVSGSSDPYMFFYCPEIGINVPENIGPAKAGCTHMKKQNLNPEWEDNEVPILHCMTANKDLLREAHLIIVMQDFDAFDADDDMGIGTINLGPFVDHDDFIAFDTPLVCNGEQAGWVKGKLHFEWPSPDGQKKDRQFKSGGCHCVVS